MNNLKISKQI